MSLVNGVSVAIPPPEGYAVDFDGPQRNSVETAYAVASVGIILAAAFVAQRLYVKAFIRNKMGIDDGETPKPDVLPDTRRSPNCACSHCYHCLGAIRIFNTALYYLPC